MNVRYSNTFTLKHNNKIINEAYNNNIIYK